MISSATTLERHWIASVLVECQSQVPFVSSVNICPFIEHGIDSFVSGALLRERLSVRTFCAGESLSASSQTSEDASTRLDLGREVIFNSVTWLSNNPLQVHFKLPSFDPSSFSLLHNTFYAYTRVNTARIVLPAWFDNNSCMKCPHVGWAHLHPVAKCGNALDGKVQQYGKSKILKQAQLANSSRLNVHWVSLPQWRIIRHVLALK